MASAYSNQLAQALKAQPAVILLWGDDAGAIRQAAAACIAASGVDPNDPFAADKLSLQDIMLNSAKLVDAATTIPFGGGNKLVLLGGVSGTEGADAVAALTSAVVSLLEFNVTGATVLLPVPSVLSKTSPLVKAVEAAATGLAVRFFADSVRDLSSYVNQKAAAANVKLLPGAQDALVAGLGADREIAASEMEKLLLYVQGRGQDNQGITLADVQASLSGAPKVDSFALADAVAERNPTQADKLLSILLAEGDDLQPVFSAVMGHLSKIAQAQSMGGDATAQLTATGKLKSPKDAQARFLGQVKAYPAGRLKTLPAYMFKTLADARRHSPTAQLTLARALLALSA